MWLANTTGADPILTMEISNLGGGRKLYLHLSGFVIYFPDETQY